MGWRKGSQEEHGSQGELQKKCAGVGFKKKNWGVGEEGRAADQYYEARNFFKQAKTSRPKKGFPSSQSREDLFSSVGKKWSKA